MYQPPSGSCTSGDRLRYAHGMLGSRPTPALYSLRCHVAQEDGSSDGSIKKDLVAGNDRLWIGTAGFSLGGDAIDIPYGWNPRVSPVGKGLLVEWKHPGAEHGYAAVFAKRTFFGYDVAARDEAVGAFSQIIGERRGLASVAVAAEEAARCQTCGQEGVSLDYPVIFGAALSYSLRSDLRTLCRPHARRALWLRLTRNNFLGFFGLVSTFAGAARQLRLVNEARRLSCIGPEETWLARAYALGFWPPVLLAIGILVLTG